MEKTWQTSVLWCWYFSENLDGAYDITGDYFTNFVIGNVYIVVNF